MIEQIPLTWLLGVSLAFNVLQMGLSYRFSRLHRVERNRAGLLEARLKQVEDSNANPEPANGQAPTSRHPLWAIIHVAVLVGGLALLLSQTASDFDGTEITTLLWFLLIATGATELGPRQFRLLTRGSP